MDENVKVTYETLKNFWDSSFAITDEDKENMKKEVNKEEDWKQLAPSQKQIDAIKTLNDCSNVLDYGCGYGWSSIIGSKLGVKHITAVDVAPKGIELAKFYSSLFDITNIDYQVIDPEWLKSQKDNSYDGFFTSNVLDVIPESMSNEIIKEVARIVKPGSKLIFSFNFYMPIEKAQQSGMKVIGNELYANDVLRLISKSDEEWENTFKQYFEIEKLEYFAWPGETKESRRLFYLLKR